MVWSWLISQRKYCHTFMYHPRLSFTVHEELVGMLLTNTILAGNHGTSEIGDDMG